MSKSLNCDVENCYALLSVVFLDMTWSESLEHYDIGGGKNTPVNIKEHKIKDIIENYENSRSWD